MEHGKEVSILKELLRQIDEGVNVDAGVMYRSPTSVYTSKDILDQEWDQFFQNHAQIIGCSGDLPKPGSFMTCKDFGVPVLATRAKDGTFHAFVNACRHRGVEVMSEERGTARAFVCPFHNWTYSNEGDLVGIPNADDFGDIDLTCHGLIELPAVESHGILFVHPQVDGEIDVAELLGDFADEIADWGVDRLIYQGESVIDKKLNWKLANDTFGETYHFQKLHRNTLGQIFYGDALGYEAIGRNHRFVIPSKEIDQLREMPEDDWRIWIGTTVLYFLFPNVQFNVGGDSLNLIRMYPDPDNPGRSITRVSHYFAQEAIDAAAAAGQDGAGATKENVYSRDEGEVFIPGIAAVTEIFDSTIEQEDYMVAEMSQSAAESGRLEYMVFGRNEPALHHYHNTFRSALGLEPLEEMKPQRREAAE